MGLGTGIRIITWGFFLFFFITASGQTIKKVRFKAEGSNHSIDHLVREDGSIVINYHLNELHFQTLLNEHGEFYRLSAADHISTSSPGKPELPVYSRLLILPEKAGYKIKISEVKSEKIRPSLKRIAGILYPAQESSPKKIQKERPVFRLDRDEYSVKRFIATDTARIDYLGKARNSSLGNLIISPVRYNPKSNTLEVITSMKIEVLFNEPVNFSKSGVETALFSKSLKQETLNYEQDVVPGYTDKPVGMIILSDTAFKKQLQPLIKWKTQKGFRVQTLYKGAGMAGTTLVQLKETIAGIYNSATEDQPAPDYLLIVGDINHIPCYGTGTTSNYTDMYYGEFTGNGDYVPEMYVGRLPARDTAEVRSVVNKIIQYEKFLFADTNRFYRNALATTGFDASNAVFMNGQIKYLVTNYLAPAGNIGEQHFYHYTGTNPTEYLAAQKDSILKLINRGTSFVNYSGHGEEAGWQHINITTRDTSELSNRNMYPLIISNACRTATFNDANSFSNRLVLENSRGAAAFIGCSNDSYWNEDYYWTVGVGTITENPVYSGKGLGMFDRFFHTHNEFPSDWYYTLGQINFAGNLSVSASTSLRKKYYWETYNIVGDPSMIPVIGEPAPFIINLPDTLPNGITSYTMSVDPFSYIAVSHNDTLWDASFSGVSGGVTLEMPGLSNDSCLFVVTGQGMKPFIKTVFFGNIESEFLNLNNVEINDQPGNNNKKADFSEQLYLSLTLNNLGLSDAAGVYAKITSSSDWLTIEKDSVYIGDIQNRTSVVLPDKLLLDIARDAPDLGIVTLDLLIKSDDSEKHYPVQFVVHSPKLIITGFLIDDTGTGNGDHIADPGETLNLVFRIRNDGSSDASGQFSIESSSGDINILESEVTGKVLRSGQITDIPLKIQLSGLLSQGSYIPVTSHLDSDPFFIDKNFTFRIGRLRESFEAMSFTIFPWINNSIIPWSVTNKNSYEGAFSAKSGAIAHNAKTSLIIKTWYPENDTLKFWYKVSSEDNYDYLSFFLNGNEKLKISGDVSWRKFSVPVMAGLNNMEWIYKKDNSVSIGSDCAWLDMIDFANSGSVKFIRKDLHVAKIVTPIEKNHIGQALLKVKVLNTGIDTIKGFNLGYLIDNSPAVGQNFNTIIPPGNDSVEVAFKTRADLSRYGEYLISVYGYNNSDDFQGNDTTSIEVSNTTITETLVLYPNPVVDVFNVFIYSANPDRVRITITDTRGAMLYSIEKDIVTGGNKILISDARLAPAVHYLNIKGSKIDKTIPFIMIKQ